MFLHFEVIDKSISPVLWLVQVPIEPIVNNRTPVFSGSQFFSALVAGVILAFAFQLMFTNLGVAAWISMLGKPSSDSDYNRESESVGSTIRKVSLKVGLGTLISVTLALFIACLLAVRLGLYISPISGAIVGLTIWGTFFSLLVWLSSTKIGSLIGSVINTATSGFQSILGTAATAIGNKTVNKQAVATAEAAATAISREIGNALDPTTLRKRVEDYLGAVRSPELNLDKIAADFERLLESENFAEISKSERVREIDRQTFVNLISDNSNLSQKDIDRIADKLEVAWRKKVNQSPKSPDRMSEFGEYLKSATREQLMGKEFNDKLDRLREEMRQSRQSSQSTSTNPVSNALTLGVNSLIGLILGRSDLSDFDVDKIADQIENLKSQLGEQTDKIASGIGIKESSSHNRLRFYLENYLLNAYPWQMKRGNLQREFPDLIYNPEDDPEKQIADIQQIDRSDFTELLEQKGIYTQEQINSIADILEEIRLQTLSVAEAASKQEKTTFLSTSIENYLINTPKENLTPAEIRLKLKPLLQDSQADYQQLSNRFAQFDSLQWQQILANRQDLSPSEVSAIATSLEILKDRVLQETQQEQQSAQIKVDAQWLNLQSYLQEIDREKLNSQTIQKELKQFLDEPEGATLRARKARFDRNILVNLLNQRGDLTLDQIEPLVDEIEKIWLVDRHPPKIATHAKEQYEQAKLAIADYLRNTGQEELNPEGIKRDLTILLENPQAGFKSIKHRLAAMDRDTLVQLLSQRDDLSEEQVNLVIDQVLVNLENIAQVPRRLARQTQRKVQNFQEAIADYLRSTEKEELNPEGIQRDLHLLINDPRAGMGSLQERLSHFDRDTLVALLSQRDDISEEDANRIIEEILVVRERIFSQLQTIQNMVQTTIDRILDKIRDYLNSFERPELNYESIKNDLNTLLEDPSAGFEALRDRFSQFDRNTLVAILSSRNDISQADADRIINQIEGTRDNLLQRAESIQQEAKLRLEDVKRQAQRQAEETRKAAAVACWWLFGTALISAIASAGAGALGVID